MDSKFGKLAMDKVSGFVGTITGRAEWMYGCNQYCLVPKVDKDGKLGEGQWFDEGRIEIITDSVDPYLVRAEIGGADLANMPKAR